MTCLGKNIKSQGPKQHVEMTWHESLKCRNNLIDTNACMRMHAWTSLTIRIDLSKSISNNRNCQDFLNPFSRHRAANRPISSQLVAQAANAAKLRQQHSHHIQMGFWNTDIFMGAPRQQKATHTLLHHTHTLGLSTGAACVCVSVCEVDYIIPNHSGWRRPKTLGPHHTHPSGSSGSQGVHIIPTSPLSTSNVVEYSKRPGTSSCKTHFEATPWPPVKRSTSSMECTTWVSFPKVPSLGFRMQGYSASKALK